MLRAQGNYLQVNFEELSLTLTHVHEVLNQLDVQLRETHGQNQQAELDDLR